MSLSGASPLHGTLTPAGWAPRGRGSDGDTESRLCWRDPWRWRRPGMVSWVAVRTGLWGRLSLGERSSMLEPACAGGGGEARNGPHDPSLLEHTWHLSPKETQTAWCAAVSGWSGFRRLAPVCPGCTAQSHPSHAAVRALTQVHGVLPEPLEQCIPASESSREGTGCLCPVPGEVSSSISAATVSTSTSTKHTKGQTKVVYDFTGFHNSFSLQRDFFIFHVESQLVVPHPHGLFPPLHGLYVHSVTVTFFLVYVNYHMIDLTLFYFYFLTLSIFFSHLISVQILGSICSLT